MSSLKNAIANLYGVVSAPVPTTRDALLTRLGRIRGKVVGLYNRMRGEKTLKDIVEEVNYEGIEDVKHMFGREKAEQTAGLGDIKHMFGREKAEQAERKGTEKVQNLFREDEDDGPELIEDGDRVKTWRFGRSLNSSLTEAVMAAITHHVDMGVVVVYSFSCDIYQGGGGVTKYHKSLSLIHI